MSSSFTLQYISLLFCSSILIIAASTATTTSAAAIFSTHDLPRRIKALTLSASNPSESLIGSSAFSGTNLSAWGTLQSPAQVIFATFDNDGNIARVGNATLNAGEQFAECAVHSAVNNKVLFGMATVPGRIVELDWTTMQRTRSLTLAASEMVLLSAVGNATHSIFGTVTDPAKLIMINNVALAKVATLTLESGESHLYTAAIHSDGDSSFWISRTSPGRITKVLLRNFSRVANITLPTGVNDPQACVISSSFLLVGTDTTPGRILKLAVSNLALLATLVLTGTHEVKLASAVIDRDGWFALFGSFTDPAVIVKVRVSDLAYVGNLTLLGTSASAGENKTYAAVTNGRTAVFGLHLTPSVLVSVGFSAITRTASPSSDITASVSRSVSPDDSASKTNTLFATSTPTRSRTHLGSKSMSESFTSDQTMTMTKSHPITRMPRTLSQSRSRRSSSQSRSPLDTHSKSQLDTITRNRRVSRSPSSDRTSTRTETHSRAKTPSPPPTTTTLPTTTAARVVVVNTGVVGGLISLAPQVSGGPSGAAATLVQTITDGGNTSSTSAVVTAFKKAIAHDIKTRFGVDVTIDEVFPNPNAPDQVQVRFSLTNKNDATNGGNKLGPLFESTSTAYDQTWLGATTIVLDANAPSGATVTGVRMPTASATWTTNAPPPIPAAPLSICFIGSCVVSYVVIGLLGLLMILSIALFCEMCICRAWRRKKEEEEQERERIAAKERREREERLRMMATPLKNGDNDGNKNADDGEDGDEQTARLIVPVSPPQTDIPGRSRSPVTAVVGGGTAATNEPQEVEMKQRDVAAAPASAAPASADATMVAGSAGDSYSPSGGGGDSSVVVVNGSASYTRKAAPATVPAVPSPSEQAAHDAAVLPPPRSETPPPPPAPAVVVAAQSSAPPAKEAEDYSLDDL